MYVSNSYLFPDIEHKMKSSYSVEYLVRSSIIGHHRGWVFTPDDLSRFGSRQAIHKALSRLAQDEFIKRLSRGIYVYPKQHKVLGEIMPATWEIAKAIARQEDARIIPSGAYAANLLGLSEQVPGRAIFLTEGKARKLHIGKQIIELKKVSRKQMVIKGEFSALLHQALKYIGREKVSEQMFDQIEAMLTKERINEINRDKKWVSPIWIAELFNDLGKGENNV